MHAVDDLDFEKVVARAERTALVVTAGDRAIADSPRVSAFQAAACLGDEQVVVGTVAQVDDVRRPFRHEPRQLALVELVLPALADAGGNVAKELLDQRPDPILDVAPFEVGAQQAHAAVDVISDAARRNDAPFLGVGRSHAADAEAVPPVNVGHGQAGLLDAGQGRHVDHLFGPLVVLDLLDQLVVGEDDAVDPHVSAVALGNPPLTRAGRLERPAISFRLAHCVLRENPTSDRQAMSCPLES